MSAFKSAAAAPLLIALVWGGSSIARAPDAPRLGLPIACVPGQTCEIQNYVDRDPSPAARDYLCRSRTYERHTGLDIRLPDMAAQRRGVAVLAAADGRVLRLRDGEPDQSVHERGGQAVQGQECGNGIVIAHAGGLSTQYCHLAKGSLSVAPGQQIKAGAVIGKVGLSGNTEYPHLHFTVRQGDQVVDPFAPEPGRDGRCGSGGDLWTPQARAALAYKDRAVLNAGFTSGATSMTAIEAGDLPRAGPNAAALVVYVRAIGLKAGDRQILELRGPSGQVLAAARPEPTPRDQAQRMLFVGKPKPASGWPSGRYSATYKVMQGESVVLERGLALTL